MEPGLLLLCPWGKAHSFAVGVAPFWYRQTMLIFPLACRYESILLLNWLRSGGTECSTSSSSNDFYLVEILVGRDRRIALLGVVQLGCGWHMRDNSDSVWVGTDPTLGSQWKGLPLPSTDFLQAVLEQTDVFVGLCPSTASAEFLKHRNPSKRVLLGELKGREGKW